MMRLIQQKERRLSSRKYLMNDFCQTATADGHISSSSDESDFRDYRGYFVFPDDASDIKMHPFFEGIDWARLHLMRPPEVPRVRDHIDTRYFDLGDSISDVDDTSSTSSMQERQVQAQEDFEKGIAEAFEADATQAEPADQHDGVRALQGAADADRMRDGATAVSHEAVGDGPANAAGGPPGPGAGRPPHGP